jgi:hypothetical protein
VDVIAGSVTLLLISAGAWFGFSKLPAARADLVSARRAYAEAKAQLAETTHTLQSMSQERDALARDIASRGDLPDRSPDESDLRDIVRLAKSEDVVVMDTTPSGRHAYPGLVEFRYTMRARTDYPRLLAFLQQFQDASLWADFISVELGGRGTRPGTEVAEFPVALTLSLFAARDSADPDDS